MKKYEGVLHAWFETGLEGLVWALIEDGKEGYDALKVIENGDHLTVYSGDGRGCLGFKDVGDRILEYREDGLVFDGVIDEDHEAGMTMSSFNQEHRQPSALGFWIHWAQRGWNPDDWARLFVRGPDWGDECPSFRATLTKKQQ